MRHRLLPLTVALLLLAACGDDVDPLITTTTTTMSSSTGAVDSLEDVRGAVVQIVASGSFVDPYTGAQSNQPGAGSGVIVDPSGLAVTNNHVVTGAALLQVYVTGYDRPLNARVVAVSECSDLAVIDIAGDGFPYLEWHAGEIRAGLSIYAAGYPLGDPEYTLLQGIVSKDRADGESTWASVDAVIEHTAATLPGSSGGPLVTAEGRLVAINYASNAAGQAFAIARDVAQPVITRLMAGTDVESVGINGEAFAAESFAGVWVYSVRAGSPADVAGVRAGDLVFELGGLDLGFDGTLATYCDVLRSHAASDVLDITVFRSGTQEVLSGQLNGRVLEVITSFATGTQIADDYAAYTTIVDDTGVLTVSVPVEWADIDGTPLGSGIISRDGGPVLMASPDLDAFLANAWTVPGVAIGVGADLNGLPLDQVMDGMGPDAGVCNYDGRYDYEDPAYTGRFDRWFDCGATGATLVMISVRPPDDAYTIVVGMVAVQPRDLRAMDEIARTFFVSPDAPIDLGPVSHGFVPFTDTTGYLSLNVPDTWADVYEDWSSELGDGTGGDGPWVTIAPDVDAAFDGTGPGVLMAVVFYPVRSIQETLDGEAGYFRALGCTSQGQDPFTDGAYYDGRMERWSCPSGIVIRIVAATPPDMPYLVVLVVQTEVSDLVTFDEIVRTFMVNEDVGG